jgi:uncharacterized membrane protein
MFSRSYEKTINLPSRDKPLGRIFELDFSRGCLMVLLFFYHAAYSLGSPSDFFRYTKGGDGVAWVNESAAFFHALWYSEPLLIFQQLFSSIFLFLCGISCGFSRHNAKRGYLLLWLSMLETIFLATLSFYVSGFHAQVYIGLLHAISIAILIYALVDHFSKSLWVDLGCGVFFTLLFALTYNFGVKYDINGLPINPLRYSDPTEALSWPNIWYLFTGYATAGSDYWSPIRVSAFVFLGAATSKILYPTKKSLWEPRFAKHVEPVLFMGRHSLFVYCAEQFIVLAIMWCVLAPFGYTF